MRPPRPAADRGSATTTLAIGTALALLVTVALIGGIAAVTSQQGSACQAQPRSSAADTSIPVGNPLCQQAALGPLPPGTADKVIASAVAQLGKPYQFSWDPGGRLMLGTRPCPAPGAVTAGPGGVAGVARGGLDLAQRCAAARVILYAAAQLGRPYQWGATGPDAFDCSGLVMMAYRAADIAIPRTSQQQWAFGKRLAASQVLPGDLVFFAGGDGTMTAPGHVGIVLGRGLMIDAPTRGQDILVQAIWQNDLVGFTRPATDP